MNIFKNKANSVLIFFLISCFVAVDVHAENGRRRLFSDNSSSVTTDYSLSVQYFSGSEQNRWQTAWTGIEKDASAKVVLDGALGASASERHLPGIPIANTLGKRPNVGALIMAGVLGNILGSLAGVGLGIGMLKDEDYLGPLILGWGVGSALGSAAGVSLAGNSKYCQGSFGMASLGGALGAGLSLLILSSPALQSNGSMLSLFPLLILPPIGAAIFFNSSLRYRNSPAGTGLLNLSEGKLGLGVPDIQISPLPVYGKNMKAELQFKINLLSVAL